jgi:BirA family biotin operon repressor/biotin-[acetyl-CoA-carboxylase] ligase
MTRPFQAATLLNGLAGLRFGHPVHLFEQIGSTNDEARRLAEGGAAEGLVVIAEEQLAGRGRAGRRWYTPPGTNLAFSLVLRPDVPPVLAPRLTMLASVAVCEAVEQVAGLPARLKWPNDVLVGGKKAGGILLESSLAGDRMDYAVLGIGLNVAQAPPAELVDFPATALDAEAGRTVDRLGLLRAILERLDAQYGALTSTDQDALLAAWRKRLVWIGEMVVARTPEGEVQGRAAGTDAYGALLVGLDSGETARVLAGEVRLRPARARAADSG